MHPSHRQVSKEKKKEKTTTHRHIRHQHIPPSITHTRECQPHKRHSTNKQSNTTSHTHTQPQGTKHASPITTTTLKHSPTYALPVMIRQATSSSKHTPHQKHTNTHTYTYTPKHACVQATAKSVERKKNHNNTQTQAHPSPAHPTIYHTHT